MIIFWKQPGNKTMKVEGLEGKTKHVHIQHAVLALQIAEKLGYKIVDHGAKITVEHE